MADKFKPRNRDNYGTKVILYQQIHDYSHFILIQKVELNHKKASKLMEQLNHE